HDPDAVSLGEVRGGATAPSAIQAPLTGHLVFSTLHTNDAPGAYTRLIEMGVEPYLVASTLQGILAQRLLRVLCTHCKQAAKPNPDDLPPDFPFDEADNIYHAVGCRECHETGYSGRTGIYELLATDRRIRKLCTERADANQIREHAIASGMMTLRQCGWLKVLEGVTSVDEVMRVTAGDDL
ncbi:MAG: ATPase, T2SS/T4P/T4SS family, partial [Pirellulales bacterium]